MDGFLWIDKPKGITSHDVVFKIKKKLHIDKIGHTGTLDPFASGLLILCLGKATKLAHLFSDSDKTYEGIIQFGQHFDTYDTTGTVLKLSEFSHSEEDVSQAMRSMIGTYQQLPPMYSAIKVSGQKLYDLAREGKEIEREKRAVEIYDFKVLEKLDPLHYRFFASVSKGTYIRTMAVDLAERLGSVAALSELRRLSVGSFDASHAKTIEKVEKDDIITLEKFFEDTQKLTLNDYLIKLVRNGVYLDERQIVTEDPFVVCDQNQNIVAYYEIKGPNLYKPVLIL